MGDSHLSNSLLESARRLSEACSEIEFSQPVTHVYNPLEYAWPPYSDYVRKYAGEPKKVVFFGMNPGPWGMAQTGVPFGDVTLVRDWLGIQGSIRRPERFHPKRPVTGWSCPRGEVSGRRFWGLLRQRYGKPALFFKEQFVANYCPLMFLGESGANRTPDKLKSPERKQLTQICDEHLKDLVTLLEPDWVVGIGRYVENRLRDVLTPDFRVAGILHPSPASPAANSDWAGKASRQLEEVGIW